MTPIETVTCPRSSPGIGSWIARVLSSTRSAAIRAC